MLEEFRKFIARGNVFDMAVGIVIGLAFGTVVKSFVDDVLMPPIGLATGGADFSDLFVVLGEGDYPSLEAAEAAGAATINYGVFLNNLLAFLIVSLAVFLLLRAYNRLREPQVETPKEPSERECPYCLHQVPIRATRCAFCTSELSSAA